MHFKCSSVQLLKMQIISFVSPILQNHRILGGKFQFDIWGDTVNTARSLPEEIYRWRPAPEKWNLLDVTCHLLDEEREDFRVRVSMVLRDPNATLPAIDPEGWVTERDYQNQDFEQVLDRFLQERGRSVERLRSLRDPRWGNAYDHPELGMMSAQLFLNNWLAHDLLHIRQILSIKFNYLKENTEEPLNYAGDW